MARLQRTPLLTLVFAVLVFCMAAFAAPPPPGPLFSITLGEKVGYVGRTGTIVVNPQFERCSSFHGGLAAVRIGVKWGYVDKTGKYVYNPTK
jgi:hypothetical protein